jgi:hypothetical protein
VQTVHPVRGDPQAQCGDQEQDDDDNDDDGGHAHSLDRSNSDFGWLR